VKGQCVGSDMTEPFGRSRAAAERLIEQKPADYCGYLLVGEGAAAEDCGAVGDVFLCKSG